MSVLDTFYIMFKSNAEEVIKGNKAIEKSTKDTAEQIKKTTDKTTELGMSFVKMVEAGAGALGSIAGFEVMKNAVNNAADYNSQLKFMADLTGQNANNLKAMGLAAQAAGGSAAGALGDVQRMTNALADMGLQLKPGQDVFQSIRERMKGMNLADKTRLLNQIGVSDTGNRWLLSIASDTEFNRRRAEAEQKSGLAPSAYDRAVKKTEADAYLSAAETKVASNIWDTIGDRMNALIESIANLVDKLGGTGAGALGIGAGVIGAATLKNIGIVEAAKKILGVGGRAAAGAATTAEAANLGGAGYAAAGAATAGAGTVALVGGAALAAGGVAGYSLVSIFSDKIEGWLTAYMSRDINPAGLKLGPLSQTTKAKMGSSTGNKDLDFWMSKGYSKEQAAGIMANINAESGGNPNKVGDSGLARGIGQWHPDRRASILKGTGIDVATASRDQQMEAYAWEMKNGRKGFDDAKFRQMQAADEAAAYVSQRFESPRDASYQATMRGKSALALASQYPSVGKGGGGNDNSVQIDKITINTQATNATGIAVSLKDELRNQLSILQGNVDDGVRA